MKRISHAELSRFVTAGARYILAVVLAVSAIGKLTSPDRFVEFASSIQWLSFTHPTILLYSTVAIEATVVCLLLSSRTMVLGGMASFGLLLSFSILLMYTSQATPEQQCGCFGDLIKENSLDVAVLRNAILLIVSVLVFKDGLPHNRKGDNHG